MKAGAQSVGCYVVQGSSNIEGIVLTQIMHFYANKIQKMHHQTLMHHRMQDVDLENLMKVAILRDPHLHSLILKEQNRSVAENRPGCLIHDRVLLCSSKINVTLVKLPTIQMIIWSNIELTKEKTTTT